MKKAKSINLPPCRICDGPASGFHYGVYTCEACKAFFKRSIDRSSDYECAEKENCIISSENRNSCAYCRYQKCLKMGMCKDAIKIGRYSHDHRASTIREMRKLQSKAANESQNNNSDSATGDKCCSNHHTACDRYGIISRLSEDSREASKLSDKEKSTNVIDVIYIDCSDDLIVNSRSRNVDDDSSSNLSVASNNGAIASDISVATNSNGVICDLNNHSDIVVDGISLDIKQHSLDTCNSSNLSVDAECNRTMCDLSKQTTKSGSTNIDSGSYIASDDENCNIGNSAPEIVNDNLVPDDQSCTRYSTVSNDIKKTLYSRLNLKNGVSAENAIFSGSDAMNNEDTNDCMDNLMGFYDSQDVDFILQDLNLQGFREPSDTLYDNSKVNYYEALVAHLHKEYRVYARLNEQVDEIVMEKGIQCLEMAELKRQLFGSMKPLPIEDYMAFYKETGIDIDGRREMLQGALKCMEQGLKNFVVFAGSIPGFNSLCMDDQISIIKTCRFDIFLVARHKHFDLESKIICPCPFQVVHLDEWARVGVRTAVLDTITKALARLQSLQFVEEETAILCALTTMFTDNGEIRDRPGMERIQYILLECLFYLFHKYHRDEAPGTRFSRVISCLTILRTVREENFKSDEELVELWLDSVHFPPLLYNVFTSTGTAR